MDIESAARLPLFAGLPERHLDRLLAASALGDYSPGTILLEEGSVPAFLHVLVSGVVELFVADGRREYGLMLLAPGDIFMPAAALFDEPYLNSARTLAASAVLLLPADAARREFASSHRFAMNVSRALAGQFRMAARHIIDLKCRSAPQRLADFLLRIVDQAGEAGIAALPVSKRHLAQRVGMTPETLSRTLQILADNGLLVRGTRIVLRDRARIEAFCGPSPYAEPAEHGLDVSAF